MRARVVAILTVLLSSVLALTMLTAAPAGAVEAAAKGKITCVVAPKGTITTKMDTRVAAKITCTHSKKAKVTYSLVPYAANRYGPFQGIAALNRNTGNFNYLPGYYPPDPTTGKRDRLPDYTGPDSFVILASAADGAKKQTKINIKVTAPPHACLSSYVPQTKTMFNDPSGNEQKQYQMLRELIRMIDCTPAKNPDGTRAAIRMSFYSMTYAPVQAALTAAAKRGVSVQALTNSHADKYAAWQELADDLGSNTRAINFATTCWQGCLTPRKPAVAGGPQAWFDAEPTSLTSRTVVFKNRSIPGKSKIVSWKWSFGDGKTASGKGSHKHKYKKDGEYKVKLTVKDAAGRTHTVSGTKTVPDSQEPEYPSLHSKLYLFSTVGTGANARRFVSAYSSGNPTYQQSRKGFNNLNIAVGDKTLFYIFAKYFGDLTKGSRGELMTPNYFRTFKTAGNKKTGAPATTVHFLPQANGKDINRDIIKSIRCVYKQGNKIKRTDVKVSMFVFTRKGVAADLWRLAMHKGCNVEIVYTQMTQKVKGVPGGYGVADCLSALPTKTVKVKGKKTKVPNDVETKKGLCTTGTLKGKVPVTSSGMWVNRKSSYSGGSLKVRMSCPVAPKYNEFTDTWAVVCIRNDIFTHNKVMLVNGYIHGRPQKYVMSGSANWSSPGLRASDEIVTEMSFAGRLYDQYLGAYNYMKSVVARNSRKSSASSFTIQSAVTGSIDVRGMTDAQLADQE